MPISYTSYNRKNKWLLDRLRDGRLVIPDHQRDFVWTLRQQRKLVRAIRYGKPIPSILLRELEDDHLSLEDGQQRLRTLLRYIDNEFADDDGVFFRDLTAEQKRQFEAYDLSITSYSGATDEEAREIFNDFQNGKPLTFGERLYSMRITSPVVAYALERLLTPGVGFHDRLAPILGGGRTPKGRRGADMATAYALCAGLAFGIDYLSRKWDDADGKLHAAIDPAVLDVKLELYTRLWEEIHRRAPVTTKTRRNEYWNLGNFGGYIAYSMELRTKPEGAAYHLPATDEALIDAWATHIVAVYHDELLLPRVLHRDLSSARSWKMARWANGLQRLFVPDNVDVIEDTDDDDDVSTE